MQLSFICCPLPESILLWWIDGLELDRCGSSNTLQGALDRLEIHSQILPSFRSCALHRCSLGWLALLSWPVLILSPPYGVVFVGHLLFQKPVRKLKLLQSMLMALIWVWSWISKLFVSVYNAKYSHNYGSRVDARRNLCPIIMKKWTHCRVVLEMKLNVLCWFWKLTFESITWMFIMLCCLLPSD